MTPIAISIIINTYNRAGPLRKLLSGLGHLRGVIFEVIVVNGPSTDDTAALLNQYRGRIKTADCPTRNLSRSRNIGLSLAAGDIVVFIDDDALPGDGDWLMRFAAAFTEDPDEKIGAIGGPVLHRDSDWHEFRGGYTTDYGLQIFHRDIDNKSNLQNGRWQQRVPGGNMAIRRKAMLQIGGFDEFYLYYLDETDVCIRLIRAGYSVKYLDDNPIRHYAATSSQPIHKRNWRVVTRSDTYFALKNGDDPFFSRAIRTITLAPKKHFFKEIFNFVNDRENPFSQRVNMAYQWLSGFLDGFTNGLVTSRCLSNFPENPPPFLAYDPGFSEQRLKIALLTQTIPGQSNYGGIGRYTYDLAHGLHERGHEVHIFCRDGRSTWQESLGFTIHGIMVDKYFQQPIFSDRPVLDKNIRYSLAIVHKLMELHVQGVEFDAVHASNWDSEMVALIRARVCPTILMLVSPLAMVILSEKWSQNDDLRACLELDRWQIHHADVVCAPSVGVLKSYEEIVKINQSVLQSVQVVPLGIQPKRAVHSVKAADRRKLLFVGRLERRKGIHTLLEAIPNLAKSYPDWEFHIVGNDTITTPDGKTFRDTFITQNEGEEWLNRVIFHGEVTEEELYIHYQTCDLFVAPSLYESFGLIFHEAMQYGKAVVGCRTGGVPEVVEHGVESLLVSPDCPEELLNAMSQLMGNDELRQRMGNAGADRVHNRTNYRTMAAEMEQVYYSAIKKVGKKANEQIIRSWPRDLPLFNQSQLITLDGDWEEKISQTGHRYLMGEPGARINFRVRGSTSIHMVSLRHAWSGVLKVQVGNNPPQYIDHYCGDGVYPACPEEVPIPGSPDEWKNVSMQVLLEHNPKSKGDEVWLMKISAVTHAV